MPASSTTRSYQHADALMQGCNQSLCAEAKTVDITTDLRKSSLADQLGTCQEHRPGVEVDGVTLAVGFDKQ
jgi:hypothetical protein